MRCKAFSQALKMLMRQDLCRSHHDRLTTATHRFIHGRFSNSGLAGSYISLHQPVHRPAAFQIALDFSYASSLRPCQLIRKAVKIWLDIHFFRDLNAVFSSFDVLPHRKQSRLQNQQLIEYQPVLCLQQFLFFLRKMNILQSIFHAAQAIFFDQLLRDRILCFPAKTADLLLPLSHIFL